MAAGDDCPGAREVGAHRTGEDQGVGFLRHQILGQIGGKNVCSEEQRPVTEEEEMGGDGPRRQRVIVPFG